MTETGVLRPDDERRAVRFERRYATTAEDLWQAVTRPERLRRWLGDTVGDLRLGGSFSLRLDAEETAECRVLSCQPPERLELSWAGGDEPESVLRVEITPGPDGALLVLDHRRLQLSTATEYGAGWHAYLDSLAAELGGHDQDWQARYERFLPAYAEQESALVASA